MPDGYYKEKRIYKSSVTMFFDPEGNILGEEDHNDHWWYDSYDPEPMTEDEIEDWT